MSLHAGGAAGADRKGSDIVIETGKGTGGDSSSGDLLMHTPDGSHRGGTAGASVSISVLTGTVLRGGVEPLTSTQHYSALSSSLKYLCTPSQKRSPSMSNFLRSVK